MQDEARRKDTAMAHCVQCGITLANIAGIVEAERYLRNNNIGHAIIERVLSSNPKLRRVADVGLSACRHRTVASATGPRTPS